MCVCVTLQQTAPLANGTVCVTLQQMALLANLTVCFDTATDGSVSKLNSVCDIATDSWSVNVLAGFLRSREAGRGALCRGCFSKNSLYTVHMTCLPASQYSSQHINTLNADLKPICHLLALLGAHHILHVSRIRVNCWKPICSIVQSCAPEYGHNSAWNMLSWWFINKS